MNMKEIRRESNSAIRALVVTLLTVASTLVGVFFASSLIGCKNIPEGVTNALVDVAMEELDAHADKWIAKLSILPTNTVATGSTSTSTTATDAVAFSELGWKYGRFGGGNAVIDSPRLSGCTFNGRRISYKYDVDLSGWGLVNDDAGAICAVFFKIDGKWVGGKFDWVSSSRKFRDIDHVETYNDWPKSGIKLPYSGEIAYVIVSADGKRRSNVVTASH